ncbi:MAG: transcription elongation factor GreB [Pseudomonadota bacterium]
MSEQPNYLTPAGFAALNNELEHLVKKERPETVSIVSWAASNGDRSENGDYLYGKKRLREIDRRIRFLTKRLDIAQVVDNSSREDGLIFFGATVDVFFDETEEERRVVIVGVDETNTTKGHISWNSPLARALIKRREGDSVEVNAPEGIKTVTIVAVAYLPIEFSGVDG